MRHRKRSTTAKPLHASGIRPTGTATNWEKARDTRNNTQRVDSSPDTPMDKELKAFAARVALSSQEKQLRTRVFEDIQELILSAFQSATVRLYGSSSTGLDTFRSDLDITVGDISLYSSQSMPSIVDEEASFSLNLALPVGTAASEDNADITRRVQPTTASHWNPTLRRRKIRELRALQFLFKSQRPHFQVKCLHKAKIPILMVLDTKTKLSIDIGVNREAFEASEHGRSTSLVQRLQDTLGASFKTLVMFLKEFLHQFELDKPFTGGLGSFRLYMMVAYVFQQKKPHPPASTLLVSFFELFGNKKHPKFLHEDTQLPLPLGDGGYMDFGGVFRIDDCVETFAMAFDILKSTGNIGSIIYEERLEKDRIKCQKNTEEIV
eukprot:jgi/Phyca11/550989/estExt2_Genewise1Plus.C_PHYCAscaffold_400043